MKTFLGLEFEGEKLVFGIGKLKIWSSQDVTLFLGGTPVSAAPDLESLEALCKSLIERKTLLGLRIQAAVDAELERRKPKLPERVGPWHIVGKDEDGDWLVQTTPGLSCVTGWLHEDQAIPELTRITLETLVALCGGWQTGPVPSDGFYVVQTSKPVIWYLRGGKSPGHTEDFAYCGPLPLDELAKAGRP